MNNNFPSVDINVRDISVTVNKPQLNIYCVQAISSLGDIEKPKLFSSWEQYVEQRGGYIDGVDDPIIIERALKGGAMLYVQRVVHYTDPTDKTTVQGNKATATLTVSSNILQISAEGVGIGYNDVVILVKTAQSKDSTKVDIVITRNAYTYTITDLPKQPTTEQIKSINTRLPLVNIESVTGEIPLGTLTLSGGTQDLSQIINADYIGSQVGKTGWYAFDDITDAFRIINLNKQVPEIDVALAQYCESRKDVRFTIFTKKLENLTDVADAIGYRQGTGAYQHTPINSYFGNCYALPTIKITNPQISSETIDILPIGDVIAAMAKKDSKAVWLSASAQPYCNIGANGVSINIASPAYKADSGTLYSAGLNTVVQDGSNIKVLGNKSLFDNPNKLLSKDNVCDLVVYMSRELMKITKQVHFKPNAPEYWRKIYSDAKRFIATLEGDAFGIYKGEGKGWIWQGDQLAKSLNDLKVNTSNDILLGKYKWRFIFVPIVAMEYIEGTLMPSDKITFDAIVQGDNTSIVAN